MTLLSRASQLFPDFPSHWHQLFDDKQWSSQWVSKVPAVNILENDQAFGLELAAPGLKKEDFQISIDEGQLTIKAEQERKTASKLEHLTRKEFNYESFSRSFIIPEMVDLDQIEANYQDGVLRVVLPKKAAKSAVATQIKVD